MSFETTADLIADPVFKVEVDKMINQLRKSRHARPDAPKGYHYKRDWYDRFREQGTFHSEYFLKHIESIWAKKSTVSSEVRKIIEHVCNSAAHATFIYYANKAGEQSEIPQQLVADI